MRPFLRHDFRLLIHVPGFWPAPFRERDRPPKVDKWLLRLQGQSHPKSLCDLSCAARTFPQQVCRALGREYRGQESENSAQVSGIIPRTCNKSPISVKCLYIEFPPQVVGLYATYTTQFRLLSEHRMPQSDSDKDNVICTSPENSVSKQDSKRNLPENRAVCVRRAARLVHNQEKPGLRAISSRVITGWRQSRFWGIPS